MSVSFGKVYYFPTQTVSNNSQLILDSLRRYLQASKWKTQVAIQRLESTLKWRRDYGLYDYLTSDLISIEVCQISFFSLDSYDTIRSNYAEGRDRKTRCVRIRYQRPSYILHDSQSAKHRREPSTNAVHRLAPWTVYRLDAPRDRVRSLISLLPCFAWLESETLPSWPTMTIKTRIHPWAWHALSSIPSKTITRNVWVSASWFTSHSLSTSSWKFSHLLWIL